MNTTSGDSKARYKQINNTLIIKAAVEFHPILILREKADEEIFNEIAVGKDPINERPEGLCPLSKHFLHNRSETE